MKRILVVGVGDIALRTIPQLAGRYRVYALVRSPRANLRSLGAIPVVGDLDDRKSLARIGGLADAVLHLAPPPSVGNADTRTRNLLAALGPGVRRIVYISTSGVYGDCSGELVDESHALHPESPRAQRRADAEAQIRNWARRNCANASILRVPGIYAADRLPLARLDQPCILDAEDVYTNHIHADDLARICVAALQKARPCRIYHASCDSHLKMGEYFDLVADAFGLPRPPRLGREQVKAAVSPAMYSFMTESRRLANARIGRELKVVLRYPTVADFLRSAECKKAGFLRPS